MTTHFEGHKYTHTYRCKLHSLGDQLKCCEKEEPTRFIILIRLSSLNIHICILPPFQFFSVLMISSFKLRIVSLIRLKSSFRQMDVTAVKAFPLEWPGNGKYHRSLGSHCGIDVTFLLYLIYCNGISS